MFNEEALQKKWPRLVAVYIHTYPITSLFLSVLLTHLTEAFLATPSSIAATRTPNSS